MRDFALTRRIVGATLGRAASFLKVLELRDVLLELSKLSKDIPSIIYLLSEALYIALCVLNLA